MATKETQARSPGVESDVVDDGSPKKPKRVGSRLPTEGTTLSAADLVVLVQMAKATVVMANEAINGARRESENAGRSAEKAHSRIGKLEIQQAELKRWVEALKWRLEALEIGAGRKIDIRIDDDLPTTPELEPAEAVDLTLDDEVAEIDLTVNDNDDIDLTLE